jgi:NAD/NADP transhydrogenase alpha subunit
VPKEQHPGERRVALVPESCEKLLQAGYAISIESGRGDAAASPMPRTARSAQLQKGIRSAARIRRSRAEGLAAVGSVINVVTISKSWTD